ncbi:hypothetical protein Dsin_016946 [Dipteronia sinensis]|uniref:hAT-like transposase RNase-H fold domain-containing protein n=1 Tax=Dipteronia sinensis TaxID=43782 RepID=A0AAE0E6H4_9ROSI|nr:hypothetical protein Dsin_016946 [Dipteronia sinensis]
MCEIHAELKTLSGNEDDLLSKTSTNMKRKFDKYWGSFETIPKLLIISIVLDPRYKLHYVSFCFDELYGSEKVEEMTKEIKDLLQGLYGFYGGAESFSAEKLVSEVEMKKETYEGSQRISHRSKFRKLLESQDCMELSTEIDGTC